jgi:hypothetical protein
MSAVAVTASPPPPMPCTARITISTVMLLARPQKNEPTMKTRTLTWKTRLRPNRSPNFPARIVEIVSASMYAVTTQLMCPAPPRSPTIVGSGVDTIVWSSADRSIPSTIVPKMTFICVRDSAAGASREGPPRTGDG